MATLPVYVAEHVSFSGEARKIYQSSTKVGRGFCAACGSSLTFEADLPGYGPICAIHVSAFDRPEKMVPAAHSFYTNRIEWFDSADNLPRFGGFVMDGELMAHGPTIGKISD